MVGEAKQEKAGSLPSSIKRRERGSSKLHPRDVMLIRRLWFEGWTDCQIWKGYRIPFHVIQKAKDEIERQATEEFENKQPHAVELARLKHLLKIVIDTNDSIAKDQKVSLAYRLKSESIKLEALVILRDTIEDSLSSPNPRSALKKIVEMERPTRALV
jgi:hypothetical protein